MNRSGPPADGDREGRAQNNGDLFAPGGSAVNSVPGAGINSPTERPKEQRPIAGGGRPEPNR